MFTICRLNTVTNAGFYTFPDHIGYRLACVAVDKI